MSAPDDLRDPDGPDDETSPEVLRDLNDGGAFLDGFTGRPESRGVFGDPPGERRGGTPGVSFERAAPEPHRVPAPRVPPVRPSAPPPPARRLGWEERVLGAGGRREATPEPPPQRPAPAPAAAPRPASNPRQGGAYDAEARFIADAVFGRNRDTPARPGVPSRPGPISIEMPSIPRPERSRPAQPPPPPAPPARDPHTLSLPERPEAPAGGGQGYWFNHNQGAAPRQGTRAAADRQADHDAAEKRRKADRARSDFVARFKVEHPTSSDADAEVAWGAQQRSSTLDVD